MVKRCLRDKRRRDNGEPQGDRASLDCRVILSAADGGMARACRRALDTGLAACGGAVVTWCAVHNRLNAIGVRGTSVTTRGRKLAEGLIRTSSLRKILAYAGPGPGLRGLQPPRNTTSCDIMPLFCRCLSFGGAVRTRELKGSRRGGGSKGTGCWRSSPTWFL